jgi:two-component system phosphate regulon response regulator PhoB
MPDAMKNERILIVDDEAAIREMIAIALDLAGFECLEAEDALAAHHLIVDERPALILLDWMLPGMSGIELARRLKRDEATREIPVIMLTARGEEDNKIQGLDAGADDYITKPFSTRELVSRMRAVLRRSSNLNAEKIIEAEGLKLDPVSHRITANDTPVDMGPTEYRLLAFFMSHPRSGLFPLTSAGPGLGWQCVCGRPYHRRAYPPPAQGTGTVWL